MYIREFSVKNYLVHKNTKIALSPITVFVGPNGGGKSAFFDAILNFSMVARGNVKQAFGPYPYSFAATKYHGASPLARISFEVSMSKSVAGTSRLPDLTEEGNAPRLSHTGEDLAACLYYMHEKKDPALETIYKHIQEVVLGFKEFQFTFWGSDRLVFSMVFNDARGVVPVV